MFSGKVDSSSYFLFFAISTLLVVTLKIMPTPIERKIKASISVNKDEIGFLDQKRNPKLLETQYFKTLDFPEANYLRHSSGRLVGFAKNFFIGFEAKALVNIAGNYTFTISSDDGFRLIIDGVKIAEYTKPRKSEKSSHEVILTKGEHFIQLQYFESSGKASVQSWYKPPLNSNSLPLGKDSNVISFLDWK